MSTSAVRTLELVPDLGPAADDTWLTSHNSGAATSDDWRAEAIVQQWEPEHQLIGALLWLTATQALPIVRAVPDSVIWRPRARWAYEIIRELVEDGTDPNPTVVLAAARTKSNSETLLRPGQPPTAHQVKELSLFLFDAYQQAIAPKTAAADYAREVLDEAYRRGFTQAGIRMQQLGESGAESEALTAQFNATCDELADLRRRAEAAAQPEWSRP